MYQTNKADPNDEIWDEEWDTSASQSNSTPTDQYSGNAQRKSNYKSDSQHGGYNRQSYDRNQDQPNTFRSSSQFDRANTQNWREPQAGRHYNEDQNQSSRNFTRTDRRQNERQFTRQFNNDYQSGRNSGYGNDHQNSRNSRSNNDYQYSRNSGFSNEYQNSRSSGFSSDYQNSRNSGSSNEYQSNRNAASSNDHQTSRNSEGSSTLRFLINSSQVGRVIGRRGAKINEFVEQSGAQIQVDSNSPNNNDQVEVVVRGARDSCQKAKDMIEDFVGNFSNLHVRDNYSNQCSREEETPAGIEDSPQADNSFDWDYYKKLAVEHEKSKFAGLPPIKKDFYNEDPEVATCPPLTVAQLREERNNISVHKTDDNPAPIPNLVWTFEQAYKDHPEILKELKKQGFTEPSPIQCQAWPVLLSGHDMIGIAQTGTGKTIAFLLPAFIHIEYQETPREKRLGPTCLVLAPTRELALQIYEEALKYSYRNIKCVCVYGGGSRREQIKVVTKGVEIVIATPGRLVDLIRSEIIELKGVSYLVLDEADRMLDMGFEPDVKYIMSYIRPDRQTVLTSATWPDAVARLVDKYMKNPITVNVGCLDLTAVHTVEQQFYFVSDYDQKRELVFEFIQNMQPDDKVLIFVDKKAVVDDLASDIQMNNIYCASLHGDRCQEDREQALQEFKDSNTRILVATDLASRGLDVKDVSHVFNMCMPKNLEDYVHRIGRTGRAGRNGISISIIDRQDWGIARKLIRILEESGNYVPQELVSMAERYEKKKLEQQQQGQPRFRGRRY